MTFIEPDRLLGGVDNELCKRIITDHENKIVEPDNPDMEPS